MNHNCLGLGAKFRRPFTALLLSAWLIPAVHTLAQGQSPLGPSFDCRKAKSNNERIICNDPELSKLDLQLLAIYNSAKASTRDVASFQSAAVEEWKQRERTCVDRGCLIQWYEKRKLQLSNVVAPIPPNSTQIVASTPSSATVQPQRAAPPVSSVQQVQSMNVKPAAVEDESTIAARFKAKPTPRTLVSQARGGRVYDNVELHYSTDQFGENSSCQFEIDGRMTDGREIQARKFLFLILITGGKVNIGSASFFGPPAPLRLYVDGSTNYSPLAVGADGWAVIQADNRALSTISAAKTIKVLHGQGASGEIAFIYDFARISSILKIGQILCGKWT